MREHPLSTHTCTLTLYIYSRDTKSGLTAEFRSLFLQSLVRAAFFFSPRLQPFVGNLGVTELGATQRNNIWGSETSRNVTPNSYLSLPRLSLCLSLFLTAGGVLREPPGFQRIPRYAPISYSPILQGELRSPCKRNTHGFYRNSAQRRRKT